MAAIQKKLEELGIILPDVNPPVANYVPYLLIDNKVFISGQTCKWNGEVKYAGKIGDKYSVDDGQKAAWLCGLNLLLQLKNACGGNLEKVKRCIKLGVYVNCTNDFTDHAKVANGVSDLMVNLFGEKGKHTRSTIGSNSLPSDSAVEVDAIFEVE